jgi:hypothetical protein
MSNIYIVTYHHRHDTDIFPYTTMELANQARSQMVEEAYADAFPEDDDTSGLSADDKEERLAEVEEFFEVGNYPLLNSLG